MTESRNQPTTPAHRASDHGRSLDDLVRSGDVAFVTTLDLDGALSSRPLTVADVHGGVLTFLVDASAEWFDAVDGVGVSETDSPVDEVNVAIANGRNDWVSFRGRPAVSADRTTIDRLWSPAAAAYFESPDDPDIRALQVSLVAGEYWSAPGGGALGRLASVIGAALGRDRDGDPPANERGDLRRD